MIKIILILFLMTSPVFANQWRAGTGENTLLGSSQAHDIDTNTFNSLVNPLDNLLANYREGIYINYSSASQLSISAGSVTVSSSDGSVRLMLRNSTATTVSFSDIDTGSEGSSTTYYVYAIAASTSATSATFKISASSTAPSGFTYYKRLGSFLNDGSSNISASSIINDNFPGVGIQNSTVYVVNNVDLGAHTLSNGSLGRTTTGSVAASNGIDMTAPSGCYTYGYHRDPDGSAGTMYYACP